MPLVVKTRRKKKPRQKQKQKQIVKQNVKVSVQSSGGSGGLGGSSIPTQPQYIPQYIPQSIPNNFRDTRGEDVILQKLSEVVDKFNAKPQPTEQLANIAPLPFEYNDSSVDAITEAPMINNQLTRSIFTSSPPENVNLLSELPFNEDPMSEFINNKKPLRFKPISKPFVDEMEENMEIAPYGQVTKISKIEDLTDKAAKRKAYYENFEKKGKIIKDKYEARLKQEAMTNMKNAFFNREPPQVLTTEATAKSSKNDSKPDSKEPKALRVSKSRDDGETRQKARKPKRYEE